VLRIARVVLALALVMGLVWIGQGIGLIPGSFMTGRVEWAVIGSLLAGFAAIALWWTTRPRSAP
jgi:hypothetical protein